MLLEVIHCVHSSVVLCMAVGGMHKLQETSDHCHILWRPAEYCLVRRTGRKQKNSTSYNCK